MYKSSKRMDRGDLSPPISKRSRSSTLGRYGEDSGDDRSPDRGRGRSSHYSSSYESSKYKEAPHHSSSSSSSRPYPYKVLCISSLHSKASDEVVRDTLYREYKRFGDISVKVVQELDERVAYVYFRSYEDARDAKHSKSRIMIYDRPVMVEAAYESSSSSNTGSSSYRPSESSRDNYPGPERDRGGGGGSYYSSSSRRSRSSSGHSSHYYFYDSYDDYISPNYHESSGGSSSRYRDEGGAHRGVYDRGYQSGGMPPPHHHGPPPPGPPVPQFPMRHGEFPRRDPHEFMGARPPPHMFNGPPRYPYPYRYPGPPGPGLPPPGPPMRGPPMPPMERPQYENKKDKFPNYLHHIPPEDDPLATRTLFTGNLEVSISDEEMRRIFGRYGTVEDIDIKRPPPGTGNAYAFVRYVNLDMAARAKTELSGQYIGKFQCKIGYGKVTPTTKIWVGGLGPWASLQQLEREFDRFGSIKKIDWEKNDIQAFITYETIDAAQAAVKDMRGYPLGGTDKRLRTDFAGVEQVVGYAKKFDDYESNYERNFGSSSNGNNNGNNNNNSRIRTPVKNEVSGHSSDIGSSPSDSESAGHRSAARNGNLLSGVKNISEIPKKIGIGWQGSMILKTSLFPAKLFITEGDVESVESLMKDDDGKNQLRITQRLRLDQSKLDEVTKRMTSCTSFGVFLGLPASAAQSSPVSSDGQSPNVLTRPLKNLVSYLKQKEAAGVIALQNRETNGILYAFPPCKFSYDLLQKTMPGLEEPTDDHLVVIVIRGGG